MIYGSRKAQKEHLSPTWYDRSIVNRAAQSDGSETPKGPQALQFPQNIMVQDRRSKTSGRPQPPPEFLIAPCMV